MRSREAEAEGPQVSLLDPAESEFLSESKLAREHAGHSVLGPLLTPELWKKVSGRVRLGG